MAASIFPSFVEEVKAIEQNQNNTLPVAKEIAIDFNTGEPIIKNGDFVVVEKNEAIKVWCYYALKIAKGRFLAFTNNYGSELEEKIIGKQYNSDTQKQVKRIVEDCLLVNKYIKSIDDITVSFNDKINIEIELTTVYQKGVVREYVY